MESLVLDAKYAIDLIYSNFRVRSESRRQIARNKITSSRDLHVDRNEPHAHYYNAKHFKSNHVTIFGFCYYLAFVRECKLIKSKGMHSIAARRLLPRNGVV